MDHLQLLRPPRPTPAYATASASGDSDILELDVLWPSSSTAFPEDDDVGRRMTTTKRTARSDGRETAAALTPAAKARSAPVRIPTSEAASRKGRCAHPAGGGEDVVGGGMVVIPPHEIVARRRAGQRRSSVLEGAGRTLKGRDLRRVRTAVLRRTGFLD